MVPVLVDSLVAVAAANSQSLFRFKSYHCLELVKIARHAAVFLVSLANILMLLFSFPVRDMFQMKLFVDTDADTRLAR